MWNGACAMVQSLRPFVGDVDASSPSLGTLLQEHIDRTRINYQNIVSKFHSYAEISDMVLRRQQALARRWNVRMFENAERNVDAAGDAALKLARSKTMPDAVAIQVEFIQGQTQRLLSQAQEAMALAMQASMEAFDIWSAMIAARVGKADP
jgi:hypothetical protein